MENGLLFTGKENREHQTPLRAKGKQSSREFPSTPAGRVPLADLIDSHEEVREGLPHGTPIEVVSWHKSPQSSDPTQSFMTPMVNRKRKRPRSSSVGISKTERQILDPSDIMTKAPRNDPALELECRYFGNKYRTPSKPASSAAPDFMHSSSPQTPAPATIDTAKLKRTRSCGMAYPSGYKRRKIEENTELHITPPIRKSSIQNEGEMQQISLMLDSIHEEFPGSLRISQISARSASSSTSQRTDGIVQEKEVEEDEEDEVEEDNDVRSVPRPQFQVPDDNMTSDTQAFPLPPRISQKSGESITSYYGDIDEELGGLAEIEGAPDPILKVVHAIIEPPHLQLPPQSAATTHSQFKAAARIVGANEDFGDLQDEEWEMLASMCESGPTQPTTKSNTVARASPDVSTSRQIGEILMSQAKPDTGIIQVSDDEFNDGLDDEFYDELYAATQEPQVDSSKTKFIPTFQRYVIVSVSDSTYQTDECSPRSEKILHLNSVKKNGTAKAALLRGSWMEGLYPEGCIVHVLGDFDSKGHCIIDEKENWLIVHPDHLISATVIADSFGCIRRAVLQDRVKATSSATEPLVYGHILHEVFQEGLKANKWDNEWLETTLILVCSRYLENLFEINIELPLAVSNLMAKSAGLQAWADIFVSSVPKAAANVTDRTKNKVLMSINKLLEVEEHVWSPKFGLKGNIDATVQVTMSEPGQERTLTVPLELKTGRNTSSVSHQAQTALYTLLLSDRYDIDVTYGILFYLEGYSTSRIAGIRNEIMSMIQQRNKIACYVRDRDSIPPMLQNTRMCGKCYAKTPCFIYHRLIDDGNGKTSGLKGDFWRHVKHLKPAHKDFFIKWDSLLSKEENDAYRFRKELWTMLSAEREKVGRCFGGLVIDTSLSDEMINASKINRYKYTFVKRNAATNFSFTDSQITIGEPIVVSDESGHYALANGYVFGVRTNWITVLVDRKLRNVRTKSKDFDAINNQSFSGIMQVSNGFKSSSSQELGEPMIYRLDKDEFSNGMATIRNNLIRLMDSAAFGSDSLRALIIELKAPSFENLKSTGDLTFGSQAILNIDQQNAVSKVMAAKNYALVLGMPGTGKTTTIAHIIRALVAKGKSVLLTSYTHTAVDNILLKIKNDKISILRLGAIAKIHPEVQSFADLANEPKKSFEDIQKSYSAQVVATTCLGVNHAIFNARIFDYCIVDEASQITLPVCLGPIAMAKRFVLVGDHNQLPPLVQNKAALEGGLDVSLFKLLSDSHPQSVVNLEHQYRMCEDIMSLSNELIYSGRLKCGTPEVAKSSLIIPNMSALNLRHHTIDTIPHDQITFCNGPNPGSCWLRDTLDPSQRVVFLNTDRVGLAAQEIVNGTRISNPFEVTITTQTVEALLTVGVPPAEIGVITLYRSQLALLKHSLRNRSPSSNTNPTTSTSLIEMHTADKFQGRDKEVILLSLVRSNDTNSIGDLLQDWRRVNVALTRARTKLIIVGSFNTMNRGTTLLNKFCSMCVERRWVYDLREGAGQSHWFDEWRTQTHHLQSGRERRLADDTARDAAAADVESDFEIGSSGRSPTKKVRSPVKNGGGKEDFLSGIDNPPFKPFKRVKQVKFIPQRGKTDVRRLLSTRARGRGVLGDVVNDVIGSGS